MQVTNVNVRHHSRESVVQVIRDAEGVMADLGRDPAADPALFLKAIDLLGACAVAVIPQPAMQVPPTLIGLPGLHS